MSESPRRIQDFEVLDDVAKLRALANKDRISILRELAQEPKTGSMVAEQLKLPANRVHYHLQQLEKQGLVLLHRLGRKRWKEERYLTASARHYIVDPGLAINDPETTRVLARSFERAFEDWRRRNMLQIDIATFAKRIVHDSLRIQRDETVLVMFTPDGRDLAEALEVELRANGAQCRLKFWSRDFVHRTLDRLTEEQFSSYEFMSDSEVEELDAGIFLSAVMAKGQPPSADQLTKLPFLMEAVSRWHKKLRAESVRYLEVALPQRGEFEGTQGSLEAALDMTWRCLTADAKDLKRRTSGFVEAHTGSSMLILSDEEGRDFRVELNVGNPLISDGVISTEDVAAGRTFDELPAGSIAYLPKPGTANGKVLAEYTCSLGKHYWKIELTLEKGRVMDIRELGSERTSDAKELLARMKSETGDADVLASVRFGLNPHGSGLSGKPVLDACFDGVVSLSVGNNEVLGGNVHSTLDLHFPLSRVKARFGEIEIALMK